MVVATSWPEAPNDGPNVSVFHLVEELGHRHDVHMAHFDSAEPHGPPRLAGSLSLHKHTIDRRSSWVRALTLRWPLPVARYSKPEAVQELAAYTASHGITHLVCFRVHTAPLADGLAIPKVLIVQDVTSAKVLVDAAVGQVALHRRVIAHINKHLFRRVEHIYWERFDERIVVAETEAEEARELEPELSVEVVPIGVKEWPPSGHELSVEEPVSAVTYIGSLRAARNEDAAWVLATEIMPRVWQSHPTLRLRIVGARPSARLIERAEQESRIDIMGFVESIGPALDNAIYVNPQRAGTGIKNSVLLPMVLGAPVVVSDVAAAGIDGIPGDHYLEATASADLAAHVITLIENREARVALGAGARSLAEANYSWHRYATAVESALGLV